MNNFAASRDVQSSGAGYLPTRRPPLEGLPAYTRSEPQCEGTCPDCQRRRKEKENAVPHARVSTGIVMGVDCLHGYEPLLELVDNLKFSKPHLNLVYTSDACPSLGLPTSELAMGIEARYMEALEKLGMALLHDAAEKSCALGFACDAKFLQGRPANVLIEEAERGSADLLGVNVSHNSPDPELASSIAAALTVGSKTSLLLSKGVRETSSPRTAVFATDLSPLAGRCLERFLQLKPKGIEHIHVVTCWDLDDTESVLLGVNLASLGGDADRWVEERLNAMMQETCDRLSKAGYEVTPHIERGAPNEVLHQAMVKSRAGLLIVGSESHGAMERPRAGSVSLHQTLAEPYPVLVIRPREA